MKYALFEFEDEGDGTAVEVGESSWIEDFNPSEVKDWDFSVTVIVKWPTSAKSRSDATVQEFAARVIAFSDSRQYLVSKRNRIINGDMEPEGSSFGRGQRKKIPKRLSSDSEMSEESERKKKKKTKKSLPLEKASSLAAALKQQLFQNPIELQGDSQSEVQQLRENLRRCQQEKEELLERIRFAKEFPRYIATLEKLVKSAETVSSLLQRQISGANSKVIEAPRNEEKEERRPKEWCKDVKRQISGANSKVIEAPRNEEKEERRPKEWCKDVKNYLEIDPAMVERCNSHDYRKFTSDLLVVVFGREVLATHSLTGSKSFRGDGVRKDALDQEKLVAVIKTIQKKFPETSRELIKLSIITKLNNEAKLSKKRKMPEC